MKICGKYFEWVAITILTVATAGCDHGLFPEKVLLSDPKIQPFLDAMEQVDRASLGFTPVTTNSDIKLELASGGAYDAMLHVYGATSRTISFRKTESGYRWTGEQEVYQGPKWYQTVDGTFREFMVIEYQTERINGIPTNQLYIRYSGDDTNLIGREFTLAEVLPITAKWSTTPVEPWPGYIEGAPDFAPLLFVLFMLAALAAGCVLALIVGLIGLAIAAALLAAGIVSTAALVGVLRRSIAAGFRTLFILLGAVVGMAGGAIATSAFTWITKANWDSPLRWIAGLTIGLLLGILLAWLFNKVWTCIAQILTRKMERKEN